MYENVDEEDAKNRIEEMVNDCADNATRYAITKNGEVVAHLIPYREYESLIMDMRG